MIVLLDENFPLGLFRALQNDGLPVQHIITMGWRGASDAQIRQRLQDPDVLFLTQDEDFLFGEAIPAVVVISRVKQSRALRERIEVWRHAVGGLLRASSSDRLFELLDDGTLLPWRDASST